MENKQTGSRGSRGGGLGHVVPSRTGFTTQRLSLIVENRRRKTWEKPDLLEIKTSACAGDSGTKGFTRRQNSAPSTLRRQSSLEDSRADDNMSVISDSSSDSVFLTRTSTPVKTRHYSEGARYYSSPNLSPVSTGSQSVRVDRERNIRQLQGLNGTAQNNFTRNDRNNQNVQSTDGAENLGGDGGKRLSESDAISTMGRRAYYRAKKAERSPTSRKFEQLLKGDISSSLEQLSHITGEATPDFRSSDVRNSTSPLNLGNDDSFLISRSLDSHLNTIHSEGTRFKSTAIGDNKTISHSLTAKNPMAQREMRKGTSKVDMPSDNREYSHITNSEHKLNGTYDVAQDCENIEGQGLTTVDSDTRDYNRRDVNLKFRMGEPKVPNYRGQNCHQLSATTSLEQSNLFVNTNMAPEIGTYGGNLPANLEIVHNDTICPNQSYGTKQSLRSDSTLQNNADQRGAEKCSFMQHERNSQNDKNAFTNNSKVAKDKSAVYVYDGSLMSPARHKSPAKLFAKKGPNVFGGFSRLFSRKGKKERHAEPDGNSNCHRSVKEIDAVREHNKQSAEVEDDDSLDNNCLLSDNKDDSIEINTPENVSADQERSLEQVNSVEADVIETSLSKDNEYHDNKTEEGKESIDEEIVHRNHGSNDSLDSLDNDLFSHHPTEKEEESIMKKPKESKIKDKEMASGVNATVKRSQSVRELTHSERNNLEKTGSIPGFPLSKAFFQAPVGRSGSLLPTWRRWSSQNNFEAVREERESQSEEEGEPQNASAVTSSTRSLNESSANNGTSTKEINGLDKSDKKNINSSGDDTSTDGDTDSDLSTKFVDYFKRNGKVAIHTDGNKTVVINSRGSFKNISYNPEFTKEGLQVGTEMSRTECSQLDLPEEDRPEENEEEEIKAKLKQYRVTLPDATVTESSDAQYHDSLENLDQNQNVDESGQNQKSQQDCDQDSVLRDGSLSDHSHKSNEASDHKNTKLTQIRDRRQKGSGERVRSHSDLGLKGYMYNPKHDPVRRGTFKWHSTQSTTDLRHTGETESESSSSAADTTSSQGYDSEQHNASMDDIRKQLSSMTSHFSAHITKKKQQRTRRGSLGGSDKAPSVSEVSIGSSRTGRGVWGRDLTADAKPISSPALKSKLGTARTTGAKVTSRDQKILELMLAKREDAKKETQKREAARTAWEVEKQKDAQAKTSAEIARRRTLSEHRGLQENRRAAEVQARTCSHGHNVDEVFHSTDALNKKLKEDEDSRKDRENALKYCDKQWAVQSNRALAEKEARLAEKRRQNMERKKSAEERLQTKQREEEEHNRMVLERQAQQIRKAKFAKESKEVEQLMQRRMKNVQSKKKQEERKHAIEKQSREDLSNLQSHIDAKLNVAEELAKLQQQRKTKDLRRSMNDLDSRLEKSRENQQRMEEELGAWRDDLMSYRKMMEQKAEEQARQNVLSKKKKAMQERIAKERAQKENMKKLMQQEEEWKMDVEATLAIKEARARMLQMEKEEMIQESRAMAHASQRLREELRQAYSSDQIDQLSRRAELEAKIVGNAQVSQAAKNMSSLTLG